MNSAKSRRLRTGLAAGVASAVLVGLVPGLAAAEPAYRKARPATQPSRPVAGVVARAERQPVDLSVAAAALTARAAETTATPPWPVSTQVLAVGEPAAVPAGGGAVIPVQLGRPAQAGAVVPAKVQVQSLDQELVRRGGLLGPALRLQRADGPGAAGRVALQVDYSRFVAAYGGDWGSRVRLVHLPECFRSTPEVPGCANGEVVPSRNNGRTHVVTADVVVPPVDGPAGGARQQPASSGVYLVAAGASGPSGDYGATSLSPASSWQSAGNGGEFTWSQPLRVPPAVNGPTPSLSFNYSSGSVDGRTASTNNQTSWVGEGHSLETGYVERKYVSCSEDMDLAGGNNTAKTGDLCWKTDNAMVVLGGRAGELVYNAGTGSWRLENDDASKMVRLNGGRNDDNDTEYWLLTTTDGTRYYFGRGRRGDSDTGPSTNSTWTVPVYGNHAGEPCHTAGYDTSWCVQAWRWNLDYVVDAHGNTMTQYYTAETNNYGRNNNDRAVTGYVPGGYLSRIDYGQRENTEHLAGNGPTARVVFTTAERCLSTPTFNCATTPLTAGNSRRWPDVPFDQICAAPGPCTQNTPTFYSRRRLTDVTTQVRDGGSFRDVDTWSLTQSFPTTGDGTDPALWLSKIRHTGKVGDVAGLPDVTFTPTPMENRVDGLDTAPPLVKWRVRSVVTETGGQVTVNYTPKECVAVDNVPSSPSNNTKRCFPQFYSPEGQPEPSLHYFHKYLVDSLVENDTTVPGPDKETHYTYIGAPAYAHEDSELIRPRYRTWGQWRGYRDVETRTGVGPVLRTVSTYMRGMDGDYLPGGGARQVTVTDSQGGVLADAPRLTGFLREQITYNGATGPVVTGTINDPWVSAPTASSGGKTARLLGTAATRTRTPLAAGGVRRTETRTTYDSFGMGVEVEDLGDAAVPGDDRCTRTGYVRNPGRWLLDTVSAVQNYGTGCAAATPSSLTGDVRLFYDGGAFGDPPVQGDPTRTETLSPAPGGTTAYKVKNRLDYDAHGRVVASYDGLGRKTSTLYTPAAGGPVTAVRTVNALNQASTSTLEPAWGATVREVDANGHRTDIDFDPLGRVVAVWLPGRAQATQSPHMRFSYLIRKDGPIVVTSEQLENDGNYSASKQLYDGLLRLRQTQAMTPIGGRVLTDTTYDTRGLIVKQNGPYSNTAPVSDDLLLVDDAVLPAQHVLTYDGAGRQTVDAFRVYNAERWRTTTSYGGDRTTTIPPDGAAPSTTLVDARGNKTALRTYRTANLAGAYDETSYTYTARDDLSTVQDPAGNTWRYFYDLRGRQIRTQDPDTGTSTSSYDNADQVTTTTDGTGNTLAYSYDLLGRRTQLQDDGPNGTVRAAWTYDSLSKGKLDAQTRYIGGTPTQLGDAYTVATAGYDELDRPTGSRVTIPAREGKLAGTYKYDVSYARDGSVELQTLPAAPGLDNEVLQTTYDFLGNPKDLTGIPRYVTDALYSEHGEMTQLQMGQFNPAWETRRYEDGTRRLIHADLDRVQVPTTDADLDYTYDDAGNITALKDTPSGGATDIQCFAYDYQRRLTEAWAGTQACPATPSLGVLGGPAAYWHSYDYDVTGNRTRLTEHTNAGNNISTGSYPAAGQPQPHALQSVGHTGPAGGGVDRYSYDDAGQTTSRARAGTPAQTLDWDAEGRLSSTKTAGAVTSGDVYDAQGQRLLRREPDAVTLYLDGGTEIRLAKPSGALSSTRYYMFNGETVAVRTSTGVQWLFNDHHGTGQLAVREDNDALTRRRMLPFGQERGSGAGNFPGSRGFVGGTEDANDLIHLGARDYDPEIGRFLSADPIVDHDTPQQVNRYAYALNNPITHADPTGLMVPWEPGGPAPVKWGDAYRDPDAPAAPPPTATQRAQTAVNQARGDVERHKARVIVAAKKIVEILAEELGIRAGLDCLTTGNLGACGETVMNLALAVVGGAIGKIAARYGAPWKWKKAAGLAKNLWKLGDETVDAVGGWIKASRTLDRAEDNFKVAKATEAAATSCAKHSFTPETQVVMADGSREPLREIKVGDKVKATDPATGKTTARAVTKVWINHDRDLLDLTVRTGDAPDATTAVVHTTAGHPFWSTTGDAWVDAEDLRAGEQLRTDKGQLAVVDRVAVVPGAADMWNLTVTTDHTFYVAVVATAVLVHNCNFVGFVDSPPAVVPRGATGPTATRGSGMQYTGGSGGGGLDARVGGVRVMDATPQNSRRVVYMNETGQTVNPLTGRTTVGKGDEWAHLPW